jgi:hypothetical protein
MYECSYGGSKKAASWRTEEMYPAPLRNAYVDRGSLKAIKFSKVELGSTKGDRPDRQATIRCKIRFRAEDKVPTQLANEHKIEE